ncbi:MAG: hypothetical protein JWM53_4291 [bacterium]|nr:hypothetical protein [bacterium]
MTAVLRPCENMRSVGCVSEDATSAGIARRSVGGRWDRDANDNGQLAGARVGTRGGAACGI